MLALVLEARVMSTLPGQSHLLILGLTGMAAVAGEGDVVSYKQVEKINRERPVEELSLG